MTFQSDKYWTVAKTSKTVYDEMVRKTLVFLLGVLLFFALQSSFQKAYAAKTLPPCKQWADTKDNPITLRQAENREDIKCITVDTAIGDISTEPQAFVRSIYSVVLGLAGGIALILIIISGYKFMTSQGNPEAIKAATGQLTSAVVGLLFIIFSFVLLEIIGVDILQIPGFTP